MRVLFTTQPGHGHFNPLVPLAQALVAAGHEVAVACDPSFCPIVEARRLRAFPMGSGWNFTGSWAERWPQLRGLPYRESITFVWAEMFAGDVAEYALPDLLAIARNWSPDVIVREMTEFTGWLAADILGIPHASVEVTLFSFFRDDEAPIVASLARVLERAGSPAGDVAARLFANLHLSFVPPSYQDPAAPPPATAHALRPQLLDPLSGESAPPWIAVLPARPVVYATGGTAGGGRALFAPVIAGVRDLDVTLIATLGHNLDPEQFGPQPDNVHLLGYLSQALLLPHCDVVVTHGGFSSVLGALACGVPLVILADGADRPVNARRVAALGAGIALEPEQRTPEGVRAAVQIVLSNPSYRRRAREVQAEIAALPGPERGVTLLEHLVERLAPAMRA